MKYVYIGAMGASYDLGPWIRKVEADEASTLDIASNASIETSCSRIRQHGYLSEQKLLALMAACDVGIIPMHDDSWVGIPNKFFDYVRAGLRIETSLGGETAVLAAKWNAALESQSAAEMESLRGTFDAHGIYDDYVKFTNTIRR